MTSQTDSNSAVASRARPAFAPSFVLLQQEGDRFSSCRTTGLTALRGAYGDKGGYYTAFFQLSIGLERLLKTVIIIDHMLHNSLNPPSEGTLRGYGHKLRDLYSKAQRIAVARQVGPLLELTPGDATTEIVELLHDFAIATRYFNLDALAAPQRSCDPLERWNLIAQRLVREDATERQRLRIQRAREIGDIVSLIADSAGSGLDGNPLAVSDCLALPELYQIASVYAVYRMHVFLRPLKDLLSKLSLAAAGPDGAVPDMHEFLYWVRRRRSEIVRKKRWP